MADALVIIDAQQAILAGLANAARQPEIDLELDTVVARLAQVKRMAEAAGVSVILVQHDGEAEHRLETGTAGWRLRGELLPLYGATIVHKRSSDAFHETDLSARLAECGATHLIIGGCMTQFCIDTSVRRAVSLGFDVTLLADGHATADAGALIAPQIVDHHNLLLSGFNAGTSSVKVLPTAKLRFAPH